MSIELIGAAASLPIKWKATVMMGHVYGAVLVPVLVVQGSFACVRTVMAGWLHAVCASACWLGSPLCGPSLSLFCNYRLRCCAPGADVVRTRPS